VRSAIWDVDPDQAILRIQTMNQIIGHSTSIERFCMILLFMMGCVALLMAIVGIYAVGAFAVNERRREIAIRLAFGAQEEDILKLVIRRGAVLAVIGLVIGLFGAFVLTRCMSGLLFQISPTDPLTFVCVSLLLAGVALLASYIPARRATKIDPMKALRYE
jgi:putative ABC transport system permease protein